MPEGDFLRVATRGPWRTAFSAKGENPDVAIDVGAEPRARPRSPSAGLALWAAAPVAVETTQLLAAVNDGYWYARSGRFMQQAFVDLLIWLRVPGDLVFSVGARALALFVPLLW